MAWQCEAFQSLRSYLNNKNTYPKVTFFIEVSFLAWHLDRNSISCARVFMLCGLGLSLPHTSRESRSDGRHKKPYFIIFLDEVPAFSAHPWVYRVFMILLKRGGEASLQICNAIMNPKNKTCNKNLKEL